MLAQSKASKEGKKKNDPKNNKKKKDETVPKNQTGAPGTP